MWCLGSWLTPFSKTFPLTWLLLCNETKNSVDIRRFLFDTPVQPVLQLNNNNNSTSCIFSRHQFKNKILICRASKLTECKVQWVDVGITVYPQGSQISQVCHSAAEDSGNRTVGLYISLLVPLSFRRTFCYVINTPCLCKTPPKLLKQKIDHNWKWGCPDNTFVLSTTKYFEFLSRYQVLIRTVNMNRHLSHT